MPAARETDDLWSAPGHDQLPPRPLAVASSSMDPAVVAEQLILNPLAFVQQSFREHAAQVGVANVKPDWGVAAQLQELLQRSGGFSKVLLGHVFFLFLGCSQTP